MASEPKSAISISPLAPKRNITPNFQLNIRNVAAKDVLRLNFKEIGDKKMFNFRTIFASTPDLRKVVEFWKISLFDVASVRVDGF